MLALQIGIIVGLALVQTGQTAIFAGDLYHIVKNPDLPSDYASTSTTNIDPCPTMTRCTKECVNRKCQGMVFDAANLKCHLYSSAMINITSDSQSSDLKYAQSVCAETALKRPSYCRKLESTPQQLVDCQAYYEQGITTPGVYSLKPEGYDSFDAWCDFDASHGWTVIQRRQDGSVDFYVYWADYKAGFGDLEGEYWLGNDNIHALTQTNQKLSIFMRKYDGNERTANYSYFTVNAESDYYRLTISGYSGNADDALAGGTGHSHSDRYFSTRDVDHDLSGSSCAVSYTGAWWYNNCYHSNLNGQYCSGSSGSSQCSVWYGSWTSHSNPLHNVVMRVTRD